MSQLTVPIVATVIGEGGSGGALALGVADRVLMLSNSVYSVITVEGCAAILWKDGKSPEMRERAVDDRDDEPTVLLSRRSESSVGRELNCVWSTPDVVEANSPGSKS